MNFNPLSPSGERQTPDVADIGDYYISIHSPRVGRDFSLSVMSFSFSNFNPLSPSGERPSVILVSSNPYNFNPLSPSGERRPPTNGIARFHFYFNPLSPSGERRDVMGLSLGVTSISIHSPRVGRDNKEAFI